VKEAPTTASQPSRLRRWATPALAVFGGALLLSVLIHLQVFGALAVLEAFQARTAPKPRPVEIAFEMADGRSPAPATPPAPSDAPDVIAGEAQQTPPADRLAARPDAERRAPPPPPTARVTPPPPPPELAVAPPAAPPPPPAADQRQSITQRSDDPTVPPPPDARFLAEQNRHVEEETVAAIRNHQQDDPEPTPGRATAASSEPDPGNADDSESADMRDRQGHEERTATRDEATADRPLRADDRPPPNVVARGDNTATGPDRSGTGSEAGTAREAAGRTAIAGGGEQEAPATFVVHDAMGTFVLRAPSRTAQGSGAGARGGLALPGSGSGSRGDDGGASGTRGGGGRGRGTGADGPDLRVSWSLLEDTYGADQLQREREAYVRERRSRTQGSTREANWREFRAAIENYIPGVRSGNQTALNAAASPFAEYLAEVHRRIHRQFADHFLPSLPVNLGELADRSLVTKLELIFNGDGTMHRVGVVETSGYLPFDYGAFEAVMRGQPYPAAPDSIKSGDGRVYVRWAFYRNERQCGTFNAEPYILPHPPGTPQPGGGPLVDHPEPGGVIPTGTPRSPETGSVEHEAPGAMSAR
jgi:hypothetical protein